MKKVIGRGKVYVLILILLVLLSDGCTLSGKKDTKGPDYNGAVLSVTEDTLDFGNTIEVLTFDVSNSGIGELVWYVDKCSSYINCEPWAGSISTEVETVKVSVNRNGLKERAVGQICIDSNGGKRALAVIVDPDNTVLLYGKVTDFSSGAPIQGVTITVGSLYPVSTTSKDDGTYSVRTLPENLRTPPPENLTFIHAEKKGEYADYDFLGRIGATTDPPGYYHEILMKHI